MNLFDDAKGEYKLTHLDFKHKRYYDIFGVPHVHADGEWVDQPFIKKKNKMEQ